MIQDIWIVNYDTIIIPSLQRLREADANSTRTMTRQLARLIIVPSMTDVNSCPVPKYADVESR